MRQGRVCTFSRVSYRWPVTQLQPGDPAPEFTLRAADTSEVSLVDLRGTATVLYFYPAADTPGCTTQACDFRDSWASLQAAGFQVVGISPDEPDALTDFADKHGLPFRLLSDPSAHTMTAYGAYGEKKLYGRTVTGVIRSTVVLDADGTVQQALYNVKATGHVARLRRALGLD
jgi:peroxiredoxin Q/BCP